MVSDRLRASRVASSRESRYKLVESRRDIDDTPDSTATNATTPAVTQSHLQPAAAVSQDDLFHLYDVVSDDIAVPRFIASRNAKREGIHLADQLTAM